MGVEFLKADAVFHDELSRFLPDVAVMPRLVPSGEQHLARRVALYKAVLRAVLVKPIIEIVVHVFIDKLLIVPVIDIDREAELMLAAAREHGDLLRFLDSYVFEVGSAGAERELKRPSDFEQFMGSQVEVKLYQPKDGRKAFVGVLAAYDNGRVTITSGKETLEFDKSQVAQVRLHATI